MAKMGADPEQLDQLKSKFNTEAGKLDEVVRTIGAKVNEVYWEGPDATRFRGEWDSNYASQLRRIAESLKQAGEKVGKQAQQQRQASS
ncbi:MAG: WXG100 family type VII secretion target [Desertimonas sp.]